MIQEIKDLSRQVFGYNNKDDRQKVGIGGYTLDVRISESIQFTSDVPENPVEDGSVIHDHIINKPLQITLDGEVADIKVKSEFVPVPLINVVDKTSNFLTTISPIKRTVQQSEKIQKKAQSIADAYNKVNDLLEQGQDLYDFFTGQKSKTEQDSFFDFMEMVYQNKLLITIEMPFRNYENMRITSLTVIKDNETNQRLKYKISAKEVRIAKTIMVDKTSLKKYFKNPTRSSSPKTQSKENKGVQEGTKQKKSFLATITG